ncbi:MAG: hypothetical protein AMXMBFR64_35010 [Myxococcales bacterium]
MSTALVRATPLCVRCQRPVPAGMSVCLSCGAGPLMPATKGSAWSVVLQPMAGARQRKDVAALCASLLGDVEAERIEAELAEGKPPLWLTDGLTEEAANGLVARLKDLHAPAKALRGAPEAPSMAVAALNLWTGVMLVGAVAVGVALGMLWLIPVLAVVAFVAGALVGRGRHPARPLARADWPGAPADPELEERARAVVAAGARLRDDLRRRYERVADAMRDVLIRLSSEDDPVGFVAGGVGGAMGRGAMAVLGAAATLGEHLALPSANTSQVAELESGLSRLEQTAGAVRDDLALLARDPDAEADLAGRLERNVRMLTEAAESARTLCP